MREIAHRAACAVGVVVATMTLWAIPQGALASGWSPLPAPTAPASSDATTVPDTTEPGSTTESTEPADSVPDTSIDDALVGAGNPDSDIDTTTATIAVIGFVALLILASWWMVRRSDPDSAPMPPRPRSDLL